VLKQEESGRIVDFVEKPKSESALTAYASRADAEKPYLGSMGIYVFEMEVLSALLDHIEYDDFGADVLPGAIHSHRVYGYPFEGYWEDIGTMRAFYQANLKLAHPEPDFNFHDLLRPIYTRPRFLPGSRTYDVELDRALLSDGCIIEGAAIRNAVVGIRSVIGEQVRIEDTVMMGADYYENQAPEEDPAYPLLGIGRGSRIRGAIIDKNARIGEGVRIDPFPPEAERVEEDWEVHDGIVVIPKNAVLADDTVIGP
jgi:glucose-1-phosphate adenylyltransferase